MPGLPQKYSIFGQSHIDQIAAEHDLKVLGQLPVNPQLASACDKGLVELYEGNWLDNAVNEIETATNLLQQ